MVLVREVIKAVKVIRDISVVAADRNMTGDQMAACRVVFTTIVIAGLGTS